MISKNLLMLKAKYRFARVVKINDPQLIDLTGLARRMTFNDRYFSRFIRSFTDNELLEEVTRRGLSMNVPCLVETELANGLTDQQWNGSFFSRLSNGGENQ